MVAGNGLFRDLKHVVLKASDRGQHGRQFVCLPCQSRTENNKFGHIVNGLSSGTFSSQTLSLFNHLPELGEQGR